MSLAPRLQARQGQSLVMTPQLQQAIKLLKLSNIELAAFVEEQLEKNPLLERGTGEENRRGEGAEAGAGADFGEVSLDAPSQAASEALDAPDHAVDAEARETPAPAAADVGGRVDWSQAGPGGSFNTSGDWDAAGNSAKAQTLAEHLVAQLPLAGVPARDRAVAEALIHSVDEAGYLREDADALGQRLGVSEARVRSVLLSLRGFEPTGVFARDLADCLRLQLDERGELDDPTEALLANLPMLAKHDLGPLAKLCGVDREGLMDRVARLRSLDPKPGSAWASDVAATVEPDVSVRETTAGWAVELNSATLPRVLVNHRYYQEVSALARDEGARSFLSECQANASWLVKSLDQRARTILKVASEITRHQDAFFAYGVDHLRPLKLAQIAEAIQMNESTVSRVTTGKFIDTPRGVFELKYFFTASIASLDGGEGHSAEAVRHKMRILFGEETAGSVMSDDAVVTKLRAQGVDIARRTVAKYRESMGVPSSVVRRRRLRAG